MLASGPRDLELIPIQVWAFRHLINHPRIFHAQVLKDLCGSTTKKYLRNKYISPLGYPLEIQDTKIKFP